jgi:hypothetical protein
MADKKPSPAKGPPTKGPRDDTTATPIEGVPIVEPMTTIAHRTRATATDAKATLDTVNSLRLELVESDARNHGEHQQTNERLGQLDDRVGRLEDHVGNLRETSAASGAKLDLILEDTRAMKDAAHHREKVITETAAVRQRVTIETAGVEQRALVEETSDLKKARRTIVVKIVGLIAALGTALATYLGLR